MTSPRPPAAAGTADPARLLDLRYRRDMRGRLAALGTADAPARYARCAYDPDGLPAAEQLADTSRARRFRRDPLGRLVGLDDPAFCQRLSFRREGDPAQPFADGRIAAESITYHADAFEGTPPAGLAWRYRYDPFGRLASAALPSGPALALDCDPNGNITGLTEGEGGTHGRYAYQPGTNRVDRVTEGTASADFGYTPDGAVRSHGRLGLQLGRDRLTGRTYHAVRQATTLAYGYCAAGWRVLRDDTRTRRLTLRGIGRDPLVELDAGGATVHVHGPSGLVALRLQGTDHAVATDNRGSVRVVASGMRTVARFDYQPFGALRAASGPLAPTIRHRFTGQEWDEGLDLYDYGARLYDPVLARFLSPDPVHQTPSPYAYVANEPIGNVDRDGRIIHEVILFRNLYYLFNENRELTLVLRRIGALRDLMQAAQARNLRKTPLGQRLSRVMYSTVKGAAPYQQFFGRLHASGQFQAQDADLRRLGNQLGDDSPEGYAATRDAFQRLETIALPRLDGMPVFLGDGHARARRLAAAAKAAPHAFTNHSIESIMDAEVAVPPAPMVPIAPVSPVAPVSPLRALPPPGLHRSPVRFVNSPVSQGHSPKSPAIDLDSYFSSEIEWQPVMRPYRPPHTRAPSPNTTTTTTTTTTRTTITNLAPDEN